MGSRLKLSHAGRLEGKGGGGGGPFWRMPLGDRDRDHVRFEKWKGRERKRGGRRAKGQERQAGAEADAQQDVAGRTPCNGFPDDPARAHQPAAGISRIWPRPFTDLIATFGKIQALEMSAPHPLIRRLNRLQARIGVALVTRWPGWRCWPGSAERLPQRWELFGQEVRDGSERLKRRATSSSRNAARGGSRARARTSMILRRAGWPPSRALRTRRWQLGTRGRGCASADLGATGCCSSLWLCCGKTGVIARS